MKLETGQPVIEGRYVVFVPAFDPQWLEPYIAVWHKGAWHHRNSSEKYPDDVAYWSGPIPAVKFSPNKMDFDL